MIRVVDIETTGTDPASDAILEIASVWIIDKSELVEGIKHSAKDYWTSREQRGTGKTASQNLQTVDAGLGPNH